MKHRQGYLRDGFRGPKWQSHQTALKCSTSPLWSAAPIALFKGQLHPNTAVKSPIAAIWPCISIGHFEGHRVRGIQRVFSMLCAIRSMIAVRSASETDALCQARSWLFADRPKCSCDPRPRRFAASSQMPRKTIIFNGARSSSRGQ